TIVSTAIKIGVDTIGNAKGHSGVNTEDRGNRPSVNGIANEPIVTSVVVGLVDHRHDGLMTNIKIGRPAIESGIVVVFHSALGGVVIQLHAVEGVAVHVPGIEG